MSELLDHLAGSGKTRTEYGLHVRFPGGEEDWMTCEKERLQYRIDFWTGKGCVCTPLVRTITSTGWQPKG